MKHQFLIKCLLLVTPLKAWASLSFDISALENTGSELSEFTRQQLSQPDQQLPGIYPVDVVLNGNRISTESIRFVDCNGTLCPLVTIDMLKKWGIETSFYESEKKAIPNVPLVVHFEKDTPGVSLHLSQDASKLILNVPQKYLADVVGSLQVTEDGIPTLFMSYYYSGQRNTSSNGENNEQHFVSLNNGANLGPWRLRQSANLVKRTGTDLSWQPTQTFIGRDIISLKSRIIMGQTTTAGRVFDSFGFKGLSLSSIDEMLPDSQRNYAPLIKGIALSQANVEVRQGGDLIYQKSVPAGSFELSDVVPNNSSGELEVTVRESNGAVRTFIQPYATQPKMVRQGQFRYALSSGSWDSSNQSDNDIFVQGEGLYGIGNTLTLFSGAMANNRFQAGIAGLGVSLGNLGGISLEMDMSRNKASENVRSGSGYASKINYSKYVEFSATTFNASLTESHDRGYSTFSNYQARYGIAPEAFSGNVRRQLQLTVNQDLNRFGSMSFNYFSQQAWEGGYSSNTFNASYNTSWKGMTAGISYSKSDITSLSRTKDNVLALNVSVPFSSLWGAPGQVRINHSYITSRSGLAQNQTTVSGSLLRDNNLNYSLSQTWEQEQNGQAARIQYDGGSGSLNAAISKNNNGYKQYSLGSSGSLVLHPGGLTLGQNISSREAFAVISAPGAQNVSVTTKPGVKTDRRGYAILPALTSYRQNSIGIDPTTANAFASLTSTQMQAVPGFGTAISAKFGTAIGRKAYVQILYRNKPLTLGTELEGKNGSNGIVDEKGYAWITGLNDGDTLTALVDENICRIHVDYERLVLTKDVLTGSIVCM